MKKLLSVFAVIALAFSMLAMVSCGGSDFSGEVEDEKSMTITAKNADEGMTFTTGSLVVGENGSIEIESELESGSVTIDFYSAEGMDDIENVPDLDSLEPVCSSTVIEGTQEFTIESGTYLIKATVTEKATGKIEIEVEDNDD